MPAATLAQFGQAWRSVGERPGGAERTAPSARPWPAFGGFRRLPRAAGGRSLQRLLGAAYSWS
eukprot:15482478-Alexandrium_andersonii.AAC.1